MSNHYKATIAQLEASRLKLIKDNMELRAELEKAQAQLKRVKTKVEKLIAATDASKHPKPAFDGNHDTTHS